MSEHNKQIALMGFLSDVARDLDVGGATFVVGGAVRDWLKNQPIKDIDVIIDPTRLNDGCDSEWFAEEIASRIDCPVSLTSNRFGVSILTTQGDMTVRGEEIQHETIEIANTRKETYRGEKGKGYKPSDVEVAPLEIDVNRREFTINTLMWKLGELQDGPGGAEIVDLTGRGLEDLQNGILRCPSDPDKTFCDDPTRMVRAVKFLLRFDCSLDEKTLSSIQENAEAIQKVPQNAISEILIDDVFEVAPEESSLRLLDSLKLLDPLEELMASEDTFRTTINNWCRREAPMDFWFLLSDRMEGVHNPLNFLPREVRQQGRDVIEEMEDRTAQEFREVLKQPGKVLETRELMEELELEGPEVGQAMDIACEVLVEAPELRKNSEELTKTVSERLQIT